MHKITVGWMYPNLLNLHGECGSVQSLVQVSKNLGIEMDVRRIEDFDDPIAFEELDLLIFLPGEIAIFPHLMPALRRQGSQLDAFLKKGGYLLALGTTGLMFGKSILREDGSTMECLGYLDMTAKERKYVWGDDLHFRIDTTKQEIVGSQVQMADVDAKHPLGHTLYGMGNNNTGAEGAREGNIIYTNCLGPLFVKNPWFAEMLLKDICLNKFLGITPGKFNQMASDSFDSTLQFIQTKFK